MRLAPLILLVLVLSGCAALTSALAVARPVVGAVCLADGFAPIAAAPVPWTDPRVVDALIALAAVQHRADDATARATLAARLDVLRDAGSP